MPRNFASSLAIVAVILTILACSGAGRPFGETLQLVSGVQFTAMSGPSCANDWSWCQIQTGGGL